MILQQRAEQLTTVRFQTRLQLTVLKPACLLASQPAGQRTEQLCRTLKPVRHHSTTALPVPDRRSLAVRFARHGRRLLAHRHSMTGTAESIEKIGRHGHLQQGSFDGNNPTFRRPTGSTSGISTPPTDNNTPQIPSDSLLTRTSQMGVATSGRRGLGGDGVVV
jgi:hypothetical protein